MLKIKNLADIIRFWFSSSGHSSVDMLSLIACVCVCVLQFALVETVTTSLTDQFPKLRKHKAWVIVGVGVLFFILGLTMTTDGGKRS